LKRKEKEFSDQNVKLYELQALLSKKGDLEKELSETKNSVQYYFFENEKMKKLTEKFQSEGEQWKTRYL
jgi:hypothetical protein